MPGHEGADVAGLRVLAFCDYFSGGSSGGSERVATEVYRRLAADGARITVIAPTPGGVGAVAIDEGVEVLTLPSIDLTALLGVQVSLGRGISGVARSLMADVQPHVLHANGIYLHSSIAAARLRRRSGVPLVTTLHIAGIDRLTSTVGALTAAYERSVGRYILKTSDAVVAVGAAVAGRARYLGVPADKIELAPNGVDLEAFHPPEHGARTHPPHVVFVGRLIGNKGPEVLVEALRMLLDRDIKVRSTFAGEGPLRARLEEQVKALGLHDAVRFVGHATDVAGLLRSADVVVRPSTTEGMSLAVLEAMACGRCVVVSDIPPNTELVQHDVTGLTFGVGDATSLADQLALALVDPDLRHRLGAAARMRAEQHPWEGSVQGLARALCRAAGRTA